MPAVCAGLSDWGGIAGGKFKLEATLLGTFAKI